MLFKPSEIDAFFVPPEDAKPAERALWTRAHKAVCEAEFRPPGTPAGTPGIKINSAKDLRGIKVVNEKWIHHIESGFEASPGGFGLGAARVLRVAIRRAHDAPHRGK